MTALQLIEIDRRQAHELEALMPAYLNEMSQYTEVETNDEGKLIYPYLGHYWTEADRTALLVQHSDGVAGFALIRRLLDPANGDKYHSLAEFYIKPTARRRGLGSVAAAGIFALKSGVWEVSVLKRNLPARQFWEPVINAAAATHELEETPNSLVYRLTT